MSVDRVDFVVITALKVERDSVLALLADYQTISEPGEPYTYYVGSMHGRNGKVYRVAVVMLAKPGNVESAIATERMISVWSPQKVIMVGIAGGFAAQGVRLGDVVVADYVHYYESSKRLKDREEARHQQYQCDAILKGKSQAVDPSKWRTRITSTPPDAWAGEVRFGPILAGEKVIADKRTIKALLNASPKALAVAMEGGGVAAAADKCGVGFLEIRGISDLADSAKNDLWHNFAAEVAAAFLFELVEFEPVEPFDQVSTDGPPVSQGSGGSPAQIDDIMDRVNRAFKPRVAIEEEESFQGRIEERQAVKQAIDTPGSHVFIYGDRGVGKTSLANVSTMAKPRIRFLCEHTASFPVICQEIMRGLARLHLGEFRTDPVRKTVSYSGNEFAQDAIRVGDIVDILPSDMPLCIVMDELDRVTDRAAVDGVAELVKALATYRTNVTVILVSIAESVEEIIGGHASNMRCFEQVRVKMMSTDEMRAIISHGESVLGVTFEPQAKERMLRIACRFPFYLHLIGHEASLRALRAGKTRIGEKDIDEVIGAVATRCDQSLRSSYSKAVDHESRLWEWVVRAVAEHDPMEIDQRTATRLVGQIARASLCDEPRPQDVGRVLQELTKPKRGAVLRKVSPGVYRFADPRMKGYVRLYRASNGNLEDS